MVKETLW